MLISNLWLPHAAFAYARIKTLDTPMLFMGAIQFPLSIEHVPTIRIYYAGNIVTANVDDVRKQVTFTIPEGRRKTSFALLVTKHISFHTSESNTVEHLTADSAYKFYDCNLTKQTSTARFNLKNKAADPGYSWEIVERKLAKDGRIPDSCIIVLLDPSLIDAIGQGNAIELPTITVKANFGSEQALHKLAERVILEALDSDTIHARIDYTTVQNRYPKTTLALVT